MAVGTIYLDIVVGERISKIELCLSKADISALFDEAYAGACPICHGDRGNSNGDVCCKCFKLESKHHADCCLAEEEEK